MICSPEEIVVESTKPGIFIAECDFDRIAGSGKEGISMVTFAVEDQTGVLRDWRRLKFFGKTSPIGRGAQIPSAPGGVPSRDFKSVDQ